MSNAFLRIKSVIGYIPISRSNIWSRVEKGTFPKPIKLSPRVTVWRQSDIDDFISHPEKYSGKEVQRSIS